MLGCKAICCRVSPVQKSQVRMSVVYGGIVFGVASYAFVCEIVFLKRADPEAVFWKELLRGCNIQVAKLFRCHRFAHAKLSRSVIRKVDPSMVACGL